MQRTPSKPPRRQVSARKRELRPYTRPKSRRRLEEADDASERLGLSWSNLLYWVVNFDHPQYAGMKRKRRWVFRGLLLLILAGAAYAYIFEPSWIVPRLSLRRDPPLGTHHSAVGQHLDQVRLRSSNAVAPLTTSTTLGGQIVVLLFCPAKSDEAAAIAQLVRRLDEQFASKSPLALLPVIQAEEDATLDTLRQQARLTFAQARTQPTVYFDETGQTAGQARALGIHFTGRSTTAVLLDVQGQVTGVWQGRVHQYEHPLAAAVARLADGR